MFLFTHVLEMVRSFPTHATIAGFRCVEGVPMTETSKAYFASFEEAITRCRADATCVGVSSQRLFYGGTQPILCIPGRAGETHTFLKNA